MNLTEKEFSDLVLTIDRELNKLNVPIHRRAMKAVSEFQRRTGIQEIIFGGELLGIPPTYSQRVFAWYDDHYGDRQKIDMSLGASLILIQGEPWKITFPLIFGEIYLNILDLIPDLPQNLRQSLSEIDKESILANFRRQESVVHRLEQARSLPYIQQAREDIINGIRNVSKAPQNLPMAKWLFS